MDEVVVVTIGSGMWTGNDMCVETAAGTTWVGIETGTFAEEVAEL